MLIITRRIAEVIVIGTDFKLSILAIKGNQVRIGITAPHVKKAKLEDLYPEVLAPTVRKSINSSP